MGLLDTIGQLFNTTQDAVAKGAADDDDSVDLFNFEDLGYTRINRSIKNARWAYNNDTTVNSSINNAVITANHGLRIVSDDPVKYQKALSYMKQRVKDWDLENFIDEALIKVLVDGACFIQKSIVDGELQLNFLAYDGDKFDFKVIRNPETEEVLGYKQKATITKLTGDWENEDFDDVETEEEEVTFTFAPEEIIHIKYMEQDGEGKSVIYPAIDLVDMKKRIEGYMLKSAHKSGTILGIEVGADDYDISAVTDGDIEELIGFFSEHDKKEVIAYPAGIRPHHMSQNVLLDYTLYLKYLKSEIRSTLMTPDSKFESSKGSRFTAKEQMSGSAGFLVYMEYLRSFIHTFLEPEIINEDLEISGFADAVGHIYGEYPELDQDSATESANIASSLINIDPEANRELVKQVYFKDYKEAENEIIENGGTVEKYTPTMDTSPQEKKDGEGEELKNTEEDIELDPIVQELRNRGWNGLKGSV